MRDHQYDDLEAHLAEYALSDNSQFGERMDKHIAFMRHLQHVHKEHGAMVSGTHAERMALHRSIHEHEHEDEENNDTSFSTAAARLISGYADVGVAIGRGAASARSTAEHFEAAMGPWITRNAGRPSGERGDGRLSRSDEERSEPVSGGSGHRMWNDGNSYFYFYERSAR